MGKTIKPFSELTSYQEDLLSNGYVYGSLAAFSIKSSYKRVQFKAKGQQKSNEIDPGNSSLFTSGAMTFKKKHLSMEVKRKSDQMSRISTEFTPREFVPKNVDVKA